MFITIDMRVVYAALALNNNEDGDNPLSKYRDPYALIAKILTSLTAPHSKTFLMYECRMTWKQLDRYFEILLDRQLIKLAEKQTKKTVKQYQITPLGKELLLAIEKVRSLLG